MGSNQRPLVSIIVPVYNGEAHLERCLSSILLQTYPNFEAIVVDDGSEDKTMEICCRYSKADERIRIISQTKSGVSAARNTGIQQARGELLMFIDSDDCVTSEHLEKAVDLSGQTGVDLLVTGAVIKDQKSSSRSLQPEKEGLFESEIWELVAKDTELFGYVWNKVFKTDILRRNKLGFDQDLYSQEDLDFCIRYLEFCNLVALTKETTYIYHHEGGKREPDYQTYIRNCLNIISVANSFFQTKDDYLVPVKRRANKLFVVSLQDGLQDGTYCKRIENYKKWTELNSILSTQYVSRFDKLIVSMYLKQRYKQVLNLIRLKQFISIRIIRRQG